LEKLNWQMLLVSAIKLEIIELELCTRSMTPATPIKEIAHTTGTRKY